MKLEIYPEECCDYCYEIIHNHLNCPVCKKGYASTEAYHDITERVLFPWGSVEHDMDYVLECKCGALFQIKDIGDGYLDDFEWEHINGQSSLQPRIP